MRVPYKPLPVKSIPGFDGLNTHWTPVLTVSIISGHQTSKRFEAIVDSGSPWCLFHAQIGEAIGMKIKKGQIGSLGGVISQAGGDVWFHQIKVTLLGSIIQTTAGFSYDLSVGAILGRQGFFDNCTVTFDPSQSTWGELDIERFYRV